MTVWDYSSRFFRPFFHTFFPPGLLPFRSPRPPRPEPPGTKKPIHSVSIGKTSASFSKKHCMKSEFPLHEIPICTACFQRPHGMSSTILPLTLLCFYEPNKSKTTCTYPLNYASGPPDPKRKRDLSTTGDHRPGNGTTRNVLQNLSG